MDFGLFLRNLFWPARMGAGGGGIWAEGDAGLRAGSSTPGASLRMTGLVGIDVTR